MRVLIIEGDAAQGEVVHFALSSAGLKAVRAATGQAGLHMAREGEGDLALIALELPDMSGLEVCRQLKERRLPTLLMGEGREDLAIRAFAAGADDFLPRPVRLAEMVARVQAVGRRSIARLQPDEEVCIEKGPVRLDPNRLEARRQGQSDPVKLTPLEAKLLHCLMVNANQVMTKARLQELIWGYQGDSSGDLLKTHIRHLRVKLEEKPGEPRLIQTINGVGYTYNPWGGQEDARGGQAPPTSAAARPTPPGVDIGEHSPASRAKPGMARPSGGNVPSWA